MIPSAGQRVGPYEILGRLGSGGMGLVFSAWDNRLHRDVAIKLLRDEYADSDTRERFLQEARAASGLNHPNICTVFDLGEQDGDPYLVMELLKGETLRSRIMAAPMSPEEIVHTAIEIADALAAAHARGVIHRDIKPANIFLVAKPTGGCQAKVLDFGLAKIDGDGLESRFQMTGVGSTVGTVSYMSPEQARGEPLDVRSDLFALGVVLYEMATGDVPFRGATSALVFVQLLGHPPEAVRELNPTIPPDLERIILKLLAKDRAARFQSSSEVVDALRKVDLKKPRTRTGWFSKVSTPVVRDVAEAPKRISTSRPISQGPGSAGQTQSDPRIRKSSSDDSVLRPVRREALPPLTLPPSVEHWTQLPRPIPPVGAAPEAGSPVAAEFVEVAPPPSRVPLRRNPSFDYAAPEEEAPVSSPSVTPNVRSRRLIWTAAGAVLLLTAALIYWETRSSGPALRGPVTLMLGSIANHSGDKALDGVILEALRMDLAQSPQITLSSNEANDGGLAAPEVSLSEARQAAAAAGATCFLHGEVRNGAGAYIVSVGVYDVATGAATLKAEETAGSRGQIADAIDRLSAQIRTGLGESGDAVARSGIPLGRDATSDIEALQAYVAGAAADGSGHPLDAITAFQRAVELEPMFTQAWLRLAATYRREHAEVAAADASTHAREASNGSSDRTVVLAAASYELDATADYPHALALLDQLAASYPMDMSIQSERALLLRLQGNFPEAIGAAQAALARNSYDAEASSQAEYAMLALNRNGAAAHLESAVERRGQGHPDLRILLGFLTDTSGNSAILTQDVDAERLRAQGYRAQVLDATGQLALGLEGWRAAANMAKSIPALASGAAYALSQAALDRALIGDCDSVSALVSEAASLPRGQSAIFASGMALGLCGDMDGPRTALEALTTQYPRSFPAKSYYLANLMAVQQLRSSDQNGALAALQAAKQYDLLSLTPYMRGMAHGAAGQWPMAIADFQFVLLHRGAATLTSAPVYAMSQLGLARAYAASGDKGNSAAAYRTFLEMWKVADPGDPLVSEARQHLR